MMITTLAIPHIIFTAFLCFLLNMNICNAVRNLFSVVDNTNYSIIIPNEAKSHK